MVSQLIDQESFAWKTNIIMDLFDPESAKAVLSIHLPTTFRPDKLIWLQNSNGMLSVKAAYQLITQIPPSPPSQAEVNWKKLWKLRLPERVKMFIWRIGSNSLPTRDNLLKRINIDDPSCLFCGFEVENCCHLFFGCPVAKAIWHTSC